MSTGGRPVDGRTLRHRHRRPELLHDVVEYVLDHGTSELSLRPMARALGVTHATLLHHFHSKEQLITEVIDSIKADLSEAWRRRSGDVVAAPTAAMMLAVWHELIRPAQRRQFLLLFEVTATGGRNPERFEDLPGLLVHPFLVPIEQNLIHHGRPADEARDVATAFVALVRGLQLDLAISGDLARVDAAMQRFVETVSRHTTE